MPKVSKNVKSDDNDTKQKRGRPKKVTTAVKISKPVKAAGFSKKTDDEIILRLPLYDSDSDDSKKNAFSMKDESERPKSGKKLILSSESSNSDSNSESESGSESDDSSSMTNFKKLALEIKKKDEIIKKLKSNLSEMKISGDNNEGYYLASNKSIKSTILDLKLVNINDEKIPVVADKTNIVCWWCTHNFDTIPCFLPDRLINNKFYVCGCFCTYSCVLAYNLHMNDSRVPLRTSLIIMIAKKIFGPDTVVNSAPQRELLEKFGGNMSIDDFRNHALLCKKIFKMALPPIMPLVPVIEELKKDSGTNKLYTEKMNKKT